MRFLQKWHLQVHHYLLTKKKGKVNNRIVGTEKIEFIGILFNASDRVQLEFVRSYVKKLKQKGKKIKLLAFFNDKENHSDFAYKNFCKKDLNWALHPKNEVALSFIEKKFDVLINLYQEISIPLEYIATLSKAKLRIGPYTPRHYCYDVMFSTNPEDIRQFINEIDSFFKKIPQPIYETSTL